MGVQIGKSKVAKASVDIERGLVFGYAIVCTVDGEDYYDQNVDTDGTHIGKAVPEHIPESAMFDCAAEAVSDGHMVGNEMHDGPDTGRFVFMFPLTGEIAKALEIQPKMTGLLVAYKPEPDVLAKFKSGEYTGFSIEGARVTSHEVDE